MPGVPREMKPMLSEYLLPFLRERFGANEAIYTRVLHTIGIGESEIDHRDCRPFSRFGESEDCRARARLPLRREAHAAKASSQESAEAMIAPLQTEIESRLAGYVFGSDAASPASAIHAILQARGLTLAVAESCTGGRIAAALTDVPGSSRSFAGGVVAYLEIAAEGRRLLAVDRAALERAGAVSDAVACAMADGARARFGVDIALATTGIAGPDGGTPEKPVGLVWIAIADGTTAQGARVQLRGEREAVMQRATTVALGRLWRRLRATYSS